MNEGEDGKRLGLDQTMADGHQTKPETREKTTLNDDSRGTDKTLAPGAGPIANTNRLKPAHDDDDDHSERLRQRILARMEAEEEEKGPDPLLGQEVGGRFTVTNKIGEGGMGAVYKARQKGMDRDVAIKVLLKQMTENQTVKRRFSLEALAVSKLKHPNTIQIFDFGDTPAGELYIAMEFLDGESLQDRLHDRGALPVKSAVKIAVQMTKSLREAHGKGIVHRDLKPDNIFLTNVGEETDFVKVLDFGVAKLREGDENAKTLTKAGAVFGTPRYMSPEQGTASGSVDHRSDLYAIGVILFEMCTGRAPFDAENALGILIQHLQEEVPLFQQVRPDLVVPEEVESFVRRLLEKRPEDRPQSAEAVIRELEKLQAQLDDVYRRVVTSEYATAVGIEFNRARPTQADTRLNTGAGQALLTTGIDQDVTIYNQDGLKEEPRRGGKLKWIVAAALVLVVSGAGGVYAMLEPLPDMYRDGAGEVGLLGSERSPDDLPQVNEVPQLELVTIRIDSSPRGADVFRGSDKVGTTPYTAARLKDDQAQLKFRLLKAGFMEASLTTGLTANVDKLITLKANEVKVVAPVETPVKTPVAKTVKKVVKKKKTTKKPAAAVVKKKDPVTPPPVVKKKKKKGNPFGASVDDVKN